MEIMGCSSKARFLCKKIDRFCQMQAPYEINFREDINSNFTFNLAIDGESHILRNP